MKWEMTLLNKICKPKQWKTLSVEMLTESGYPVYGANGKIGFYNEYTHANPTLMISCRGAGCGSMHISEPYSYINGNAMSLDNMSSDYDIKFLYYYFKHLGFSNVISGSAQPQITRQGLSLVTVPIVKRPIQQKIAAILDEADALRRKDKALLAKYDELLQAVFYDMFGDPVKNEKGWKIKKLNELCNKITDGTHFSPPMVDAGIPYITAKHLKPYKIDFYANPTYISQEEHQKIFSRCRPEKGDVLYIKDGATTGIAAINEYDFEFSMLSSLALIKPNKNVFNNCFLVAYLNHPIVKQKLILNSIAGAAIQRFTLSKINSFECIVPPIKLQNEFSNVYQNVLLQKSQIAQQQTHSENLFQSLIQKAFKGELVA